MSASRRQPARPRPRGGRPARAAATACCVAAALVCAGQLGELGCPAAQARGAGVVSRGARLSDVVSQRKRGAAAASWARREKLYGVNYGNRFIPEDWMVHPYNFYEGVEPHCEIGRVALWDLADGQDPSPRKRMLDWLNNTIQESHFREMRRFGVELVRVPCGYWNWVGYEEDDGPEASTSLQGVPVAERLRGLHRIARPRDYRPFFDRIFQFAGKHGIKVLLDLHGLPGSQNGEIHSGVCLELKEEPEERGKTFFESEANKLAAVRAVREMARYAQGKGSSLFGVQVVNEPHLWGDAESQPHHDFIRDYYTKAIVAAREFLAPSVPVVLFEWTFNMEKWEPNAFPENDFGCVLWDTHIYHFPDENETWVIEDNGMEKLKHAYSWDLEQLRYFAHTQGGRVFVGEFSLAGPSFFTDGASAYGELAEWLLEQFLFVSAGSLLWTFDGLQTAWSMKKQVAQRWVDWRRLVGTARRDAARSAPPVRLRAPGGQWLSAEGKSGAVSLASGAEPDWWEEWVPYYFNKRGQLKLALRSKAHGTWLSVDEKGQVFQSDSRSTWEQFCVVACRTERGVRRVALQTFHGTWLAAAKGGSHVHAVRGSAGAPPMQRSAGCLWAVE